MLRLKDDWKFNMNDALINTFTTLSIELEDEKTRHDELIPVMKNEIDLINNINVLHIFATTNQEYKKTLVHTLKLDIEGTKQESMFNVMYDSAGKTPFCHSFDQNNIYMMKSFMDHIQDRGNEEGD